MIERFGDPERGGFFSTSADHEELIARRKEIGDHPIPSGNSAAALGLLRLAALTGERALRAARPRASSPSSPSRPSATPTPSPTCCGRSTSTSPRPGRSPWSATTWPSWPRSSATLPPPPGPRRRPRGHRRSRRCSRDRTTVDGQPAAYVCENFTCQLPVTDPQSSTSFSDARRRQLEDRQEVLDLVRGDLDAVVVPFLPLDLDEAAEGVLAEGAQDQLRLGGDLDRLAERRRQLLDPLVRQLLRARGGRGSAPSAPAARSPSRPPPGPPAACRRSRGRGCRRGRGSAARPGSPPSLPGW